VPEPGAGLEPCSVELSEFDVTPAGPRTEPSGPRTAPVAVDCPEYADAEIGLVTRGLLAGQSVATIAGELGLDSQNVPASLRDLVRQIRSLGATDPRPGGRRRGIPPEDEATARHLRYDQKLTIAEIAKRLGTTEGAVSRVLANRRKDGEG
jgi:transposase-like protein